MILDSPPLIASGSIRIKPYSTALQYGKAPGQGRRWHGFTLYTYYQDDTVDAAV